MNRPNVLPFRQVHLDFHTAGQIPGVGARFDAGLVNPNGSPRPAFRVFKRLLRGRLR